MRFFDTLSVFRRSPPVSNTPCEGSHCDADGNFEFTAQLVAAGITLPHNVRCAVPIDSDANIYIRSLLSSFKLRTSGTAQQLCEKLILEGRDSDDFMGVAALIELGILGGPGDDTSPAKWLEHLARHGREPPNPLWVGISLQSRFARLLRACAAHGATDDACRAATQAAIIHHNRDGLCAIIWAKLISPTDALDAEGSTPLHHTARSGQPDMVWDLIQAGADANALNTMGQTPLHVAASSRASRELVKNLIHARADSSLKDARGDTPVALAQRHQNPTFIAALIDCGLGEKPPIDGTTALHKAALLGDDVVIQGLLMAKAKVNATNDEGCTPLHFAARAGKTSSVVLIANSGANLDARDQHGRSAAHEAAFHGHTAALVALLEQGADAHATTKSGATPMDEARGQRHHETVVVMEQYLARRR